MGKLVTYLSVLIFVDLLFIATGQVCSEGVCSLTSILFNAVLQIGDITASQFFSQIIGDFLNFAKSGIGIASLAATAVVAIGAVATKDISLLFVPIALVLSAFAGDFVIITANLVSANPLLGTLIMAPLSLLYVFSVLEWLRGKD